MTGCRLTGEMELWCRYNKITLLRLEQEQKNFAYFSSLSFYLMINWNDEYVHTLLRVFSRTVPDFRSLWAKSIYPFSYQNGAKTLPLVAAHTYKVYGLYIWVPPGHAYCVRFCLKRDRDLSSGLAYLPHVPDKIKRVTKRIFSETVSRIERFENASFSFSQ